ncbi:MAG: HAMP domain-containing histidine kinase [Eubacterium sp.]|nr:HAMP domain-containing histidine kinase [Eubacterium sp.]
MNIALTISIILNIALLIKICAMRFSLKELAEDYRERMTLDSDTLIGVSSRDKRIRELASSINDTITEMRRAFHRYRQGDMNIRNVITNVAHDIRTPLTAISGYLELADRLDKSDELKEYLSIIGERTEHMKLLTNDLFDYMVVNDIDVQEEKQKVNIGKVVEDAVMNFYPAFTEKGIKPDIYITENKVVRKLYPSYVDRIINNLISNAVKYSEGDLDISLSDEGTFIIANTAKNLDRVQVEKLFDRFYTVENGMAKSTGIGLSIVRTFAEKMNIPVEASYENGRLIITIEF